MSVRSVSAFAFALLIPVAAAAQTTQKPSPPPTVNPIPSEKKVNVKEALERAKIWANAFVEVEEYKKGAGGAVKKKVKTTKDQKAMLFVGGGLDAYGGNGATAVGIMGNASVSFPVHEVVAPYAGFGAGFVKCCGSTDFATEILLGADIGIAPNLFVQVGLALRQIYFEGETFGETIWRFGIAIPLGPR